MWSPLIQLRKNSKQQKWNILLIKMRAVFLTDAVGHELESVWSKEHLRLPVDVTHQHREAKRLKESQKEGFFPHFFVSVLNSTSRNEAQPTPYFSASWVEFLSSSLISCEADNFRASWISLSDSPALFAAWNQRFKNTSWFWTCWNSSCV